MMRALPSKSRVFAAAVTLGVLAGLASCVSGGTGTEQDREGASAGSPGVGGAGGMSAGGSQSSGGLMQSGAGGQAAGGLASGGSTAGGVAVGGSSGANAGTGSGGLGGTAGSAGTGAISGSGGASAGGSGGSGPACTDEPPDNGGSCSDAVAFGWCGQPWFAGSCDRTCGTCTGGGTGGANGTGGAGGTGSGGSSGSGGSAGKGGNVQPPPNISNGQDGWGSRYWDCCKPACGWSANAGGTPMKACSKENQTLSDPNARNACESGGSAFMCWDGAPWQVGENLSYGFVATTGSNYVCGRCFHLQFTGASHNAGNNAGAQSLSGKHMIVQVVNNGGLEGNQFDLLIPGGGVGALNACSNQWGTSDLGATYGGFLAGCSGDKSCVQNKCSTIFADKPGLMAGCEWFLGWFNAADNPSFKFERIACPAELMQHSGLSDR